MREENTSYKLFGIEYPAPVTVDASNPVESFSASVAPRIAPTREDEEKSATLLKIEPNQPKCAFCGKPATCLEYLHPLVNENGFPSGYCTDPANLVPCCDECKSNKNGEDWKKYMEDPQFEDVTNSDEKKQERVELIYQYEHDMPLLKVQYENVLGLEATLREELSSIKKAIANGSELDKTIEHAVSELNFYKSKISDDYCSAKRHRKWYSEKMPRSAYFFNWGKSVEQVAHSLYYNLIVHDASPSHDVIIIVTPDVNTMYVVAEALPEFHLRKGRKDSDDYPNVLLIDCALDNRRTELIFKNDENGRGIVAKGFQYDVSDHEYEIYYNMEGISADRREEIGSALERESEMNRILICTDDLYDSGFTDASRWAMYLQRRTGSPKGINVKLDSKEELVNAIRQLIKDNE